MLADVLYSLCNIAKLRQNKQPEVPKSCVFPFTLLRVFLGLLLILLVTSGLHAAPCAAQLFHIAGVLKNVGIGRMASVVEQDWAVLTIVSSKMSSEGGLARLITQGFSQT